MARIAVRDENGFNQIFASIGSTPLRGRRRNDWLVAQIARYGGRRVLEIGCGTGATAAYLAAQCDAEIIAADISKAFLAEARAQHEAANLRFVHLDLLHEAAAHLGRFDMVVGNGILHHLVTRLPEVLGALRDVTEPGGGLAFIEPNLLNPYCVAIFGTRLGRRLARLEPDEMAFMPGALRRALSAAGWRDVRVTTRDFLLPGLPDRLARWALAVEPALERSALTRWLAQSHFITARA